MRAPGSCRIVSLLIILLIVVALPNRGYAQRGSSGTKKLDSTSVEAGKINDDLTDSTSRLYYDSSAVQPRVVDTALLETYRASDDFDYDRLHETRSLWDKFNYWLKGLLGDLLPGSLGLRFYTFMVDWFPYIAVVLAVGLLVWVIARGGMQTPFSRKPADTGVGEFYELGENIDTMDFDALIQNAVDAGHYRRAVRLLYLKSIKDLSDHGMVQIGREKTNADYLRELSNAGLRGPFSDITLLFEYVWYGNIPVDGVLFPNLREAFTTFSSILRTTR